MFFNNLSRRNGFILVSNDFISTVGNSIFTILIMWYIFEKTQSPLLMSVIGSFIHISTFIVGPIAGVFVDRSNNPIKVLSVVLYFNAMILLLISIGIWTLSNIHELIFILLLIFIRDCAYAFTHPAETKILPNAVEANNIPTIIGYRTSSSQIGALLGNALSGFLIVLLGIVGSVFINSITFLIAALLLNLLKPLKEFAFSEKKEKKLTTFIKFDYSVFSEVISVVKIIYSNKQLRSILSITILINVASMTGPLYVVYVSEHLNENATIYGFLNVAGLIGGIISGVVMGVINKFVKPNLLIVISYFITGVLFISLSFVTNYIFALPLYALVSFFLTLANIGLYSIQILIIPEDYLGRISSTMMSLNVILIPAINIIGGLIAQTTSVGVVFLIAGIWTVLISLLALYFKDIFNIRKNI